MSKDNDLNNDQSCTQKSYIVGPEDLPLSCPSRHNRIWDAHPRVYLPIAEEGKVRCPYCSAIYILNKESEKNHG